MIKQLIYWSFGYGLYNMSKWLISGINCWLSVEVTLNLCVHSNFAWNSDVGGNICNQSVWVWNNVTFCALSNFFQFKCTGWINVFLCMSCQLKLNLLLSLNCEVICYLPKSCTLVVYPSYGIWIGFLLLRICHPISCFTLFGRCIGTSFHNGFEFKLDLNPGITGTNIVSELSFH